MLEPGALHLEQHIVLAIALDVAILLQHGGKQGNTGIIYFRMDGSGLFSLSACEQIEKFEEWVEVPVSFTVF